MDGEGTSSIGEALRGTSDYGFEWVHASTQGPGFSINSSMPDLFNTAPQVNSVVDNGNGRFTITFPNIGAVVGGNVQVTASGGTTRCKVGGWNSSGSSLSVTVNCFNTSGVGVPSEFEVSYYRETSSAADGGYLWGSDATFIGTYTPPSTYQFNSTGALNTVSHSTTGLYRAHFPGLTTVGGTVEVTAYGASSEYCKIQNWGPSGDGTDVNVRCFNASGGLTNAQFSLAYGHKTTHGGTSYAYTWSGGGVYQGAQADSPFTSSHTIGDAITVTGQSTGSYTVVIPQLPRTTSALKVTAYGTGPESCNITSTLDNLILDPRQPGTRISLQCFSANGTAANSAFTLAFAVDTEDVWTAFTSEEFAPALCDGNSTVSAVRCTGGFCDNLSLVCASPTSTGALSLDHSRDWWTPYFSEEGAGTVVVTCGLSCTQRQLNQGFCSGGVMTGLQCTGSNCDNVRLRCTPASSGGVDPNRCFWTSFFSEEQGVSVFNNFAQFRAVGAECSGSYCDNLRFYVCQLL